MPFPTDWIVPDWPAPAHVRAVFTTRSGGVSAAPFDSFNLGDHVRDDPAAVARNRQRLRELTGAHPVFLQQVHGTEVLTLAPDTPDGCVADACLSTTAGLACTVMVADCLPLLLTDTEGTVVAAAHAGWRGLAGHAGHGVIESVFARFVQALRQRRPQLSPHDVPAQTLAWLGPCIGPAAFEVGAEVREAFVAGSPAAATCFAALPAAGQFMADLPGLARLRLQALGVAAVHGHDSTPPWCTVSQPLRFFSHRRDAARLGSSGRMAASIWLGRC